MASLIRSVIPIVFMTATGLAIGWRVHASFVDALAGYGLMVVFSFAVIWIGVMMASLVSTPEAVQGVAFIAIFPITFIASTFVPTSTLPGGLKTFAEWNPTSALANPTMELHDATGAIIASNDNWADTQQLEVVASGIPPPNELESAIAGTIAPGNYTAIVGGFNNGTGNALVEIYGLN